MTQTQPRCATESTQSTDCVPPPVQAERKVMEVVNCPFVVRLKYAFQSPTKLFLVMDYVSGGELFSRLQDKYLNEEEARFYAAETLLALEHLHKLDIIYR